MTIAADWRACVNPMAIFRAELPKLGRVNRNGWASAPCPFHEDRTPSLSVNVETGRFRCFGCGAHGDLVDFVRQRHGLGFREALRYLGVRNA
jgi:DNA primase